MTSHMLVKAGAAACLCLLAACTGTGNQAPEMNRAKMNQASADSPADRAVINFADLRGRINGWRADGSDAIYLEVGVNEWYHATFMSRCSQLPFSDTIGIVTDSLSQVDRFSSIVVGSPTGWERCWFRSFEKIEGEPPN